jgi:hypothetical protein
VEEQTDTEVAMSYPEARFSSTVSAGLLSIQLMQMTELQKQ